MTTYVRRGDYIVRRDVRRHDIAGKNGTRVIKVGCNLEAAMYPRERVTLDPTDQLIAEFEAQRQTRNK